MGLTDQLSRYLGTYEKNPNTLVFAPLADKYRELGMIAEAKIILKKGLSRHSDYLLGYIVLSKCFFDQEEFYQAYLCLRDKKEKAKDNIMFWSHFFKVSKKLNYHEESLESLEKLNILKHGKDLWVTSEIDRTKSILRGSENRKLERQITSVDDWEYLSIPAELKKKKSLLDDWEMDSGYEDSHH